MTFRFARHTNNLEKLKYFYTVILGLEILGKFENHNGYDGIFLGKSDLNWHLEFTQTFDKVQSSFNDDDNLVFYPNNQLEFNELLKRIDENCVPIIKAKNPYWNENGKMILDPDGYRIVISNLKINN